MIIKENNIGWLRSKRPVLCMYAHNNNFVPSGFMAIVFEDGTEASYSTIATRELDDPSVEDGGEEPRARRHELLKRICENIPEMIPLTRYVKDVQPRRDSYVATMHRLTLYPMNIYVDNDVHKEGKGMTWHQLHKLYKKLTKKDLWASFTAATYDAGADRTWFEDWFPKRRSIGR